MEGAPRTQCSPLDNRPRQRRAAARRRVHARHQQTKTTLCAQVASTVGAEKFRYSEVLFQLCCIIQEAKRHLRHFLPVRQDVELTSVGELRTASCQRLARTWREILMSTRWLLIENQGDCSTELPDRNINTVGASRFHCPDRLFQPCFKIHDTSVQGAMTCDIDIREDTCADVALPRIRSMCQGIGGRMAKELTALAVSTMKFKGVTPPERKYSVSRTGGMLAPERSAACCWVGSIDLPSRMLTTVRCGGFC